MNDLLAQAKAKRTELEQKLEQSLKSNALNADRKCDEYESQCELADYFIAIIKQYEPQWTPLSEGLPTENDMYLVTAMDILVNRLVVYTNSFLDGEFRETFGFEIIAWLSLPKPYQAEKEEKK